MRLTAWFARASASELNSLNKQCHLHPRVGEQESIIRVDIKREFQELFEKEYNKTTITKLTTSVLLKHLKT